MINILLCGNDKIFDGILTTLISIQHHCKDPLKVHIFTMDVSHLNPNFTCLTDDKINFINKMLKDTNIESEAIKFDLTEEYKSKLGASPNENTSYSPYALLRLFADKICFNKKKLLYLDIDILFNDNIHKIYDIDITNYEYAAAKDHYGKVFINNNYINSGVILINAQKVLETGLFEKARDLLNSKKMLFPDQSAIYDSTTCKLVLPEIFNSQKTLKKDTVIRHFSKTLKTTPYPRIVNVKPWNITELHKVYNCYEFDEILFEYIYYKKLYEKTKQKEF